MFRVVLDDNNKVIKAEPFLSGFLVDENADPPMWGRPVDVLVMKDPQMTPMAANLSNADMNDLAAYFSAQEPAPPLHKTDPANAVAAPKLAQQFNCVQCHGPALAGRQHIPRLAGQQLEYLKTQLRGFKAQTRADLDGNMTSASQVLTDADIDVLVDYMSGLGTP